MRCKLVTALIVLLAVLTAPPVVRAEPTTFTDPSGDNGAWADVGRVTVELDREVVTVNVAVANMPKLLESGVVGVSFDTDRNASTGSIAGGDYVALLDLETAGLTFLKWDGTDYGEAGTADGDVRALLGGEGVEFQVRHAALGKPTAFSFSVLAASGSIQEGRLDFAPDRGAWPYEVKAPVEVKSLDARFVPAQPKAGATFQPAAVRLDLSNGTTVFADSYRCVATLAGKLLRGTGRGGCTFRLPKTARGKRLAVTVYATYKGDTSEFDPYVFKVR